jgi:hypothetical protein
LIRSWSSPDGVRVLAIRSRIITDPAVKNRIKISDDVLPLMLIPGVEAPGNIDRVEGYLVDTGSLVALSYISDLLATVGWQTDREADDRSIDEATNAPLCNHGTGGFFLHGAQAGEPESGSRLAMDSPAPMVRAVEAHRKRPRHTLRDFQHESGACPDRRPR